MAQACGVLASLAALVSFYRRRDDAELRNATLRSLPLLFFAAHVAARGAALGGPSTRVLGAAAIAAAAIGDALSLRPHTPAFLSGLILKHLVSPALLIALACVQGGRIPTAPLLVVFAAFAWYIFRASFSQYTEKPRCLISVIDISTRAGFGLRGCGPRSTRRKNKCSSRGFRS